MRDEVPMPPLKPKTTVPVPAPTEPSSTSPPFAFLIVAGAVRRGKFGRGIPLLGYFLFLLSVGGGIGFLDPIPYLLEFQLPALAVYGLFMLALGLMLIRLGRMKPVKPSLESSRVEMQ